MNTSGDCYEVTGCDVTVDKNAVRKTILNKGTVLVATAHENA
jgi:hypothetical protein